MDNIREIQLRFKSIAETKQITKAMKLISASKLKKARKQLDNTLPFYNTVRVTLADILQHSASIENPFFDLRNKKEGHKKAYLVLSGDKGLAGGYNHNIIKLAEKQISDDPDSLLFVAGLVGYNYFTRKKANVFADFNYPVQNPTVFRTREITELLMDLFLKEEIDELFVVYTEMVSSIKLEPKIIKLLPLELDSLIEDLSDEGLTRDENLAYEPSPEAVFDVLIPKYIKGILYSLFVEAFTSEQSSRMTAMDSATTNADEMLQKLHLYYNRARQAAITQEISEIVGGADALNN
ncbi:MAG: ATP synthase F1 subunit gamma [Clostridia bacterium]|jgi:F-type H+-transporting ATPase subunit gamma